MLVTFPADRAATRLLLDTTGRGLPVARWVGVGEPAPGQPGTALLAEHSTGLYTRPGLRGHRADGGGWSTAFVTSSTEETGDGLVVQAHDAAAGLALRTEVEALAGGALRIRHVLTNTGAGDYHLDGLEVTVPLPDDATELLDFTGRHERERVPQRHPLVDGLWLREARHGRPGLGSATLLVAGTAGFGFSSGRLLAVALAWSGNSVLRAERDGATGATLGGGELLLPGEVVLAEGQSYAAPWLVVVAAADGLDAAAGALHTWQRALPAHPAVQPVTLNVWEAVYFDHDADRLRDLAGRAARIGVERFVLDDGWFHARRHDRAGLGDWWVDPAVWPDGLAPLSEHVRALGMQFGLWFEPEMVNPDSDLYRAHPDWVLRAADGREPLLHRHQLVVDLTNSAAWAYLLERIEAVLTATGVDAVKWDHNRDLLEAGSPARGFRPAGHEQALAHYALLDELRARHPGVEWESCASGGGRVDLGVVERVQRVWTSDMTDALSRQLIQRWTAQLLAPEYLGAHVSAPRSHQTGRTLSLDFRAGTALFGSFGIEWDLTAATDAELGRLAEWVQRYKRWRPVLHSGRVARIESADPAVLMHGVVAADGRSALLAHVQLDESASNRGVTMRVPGLADEQQFALAWEGPVDGSHLSVAAPVDPAGPTAGEPHTGAALAAGAIWIPRRRPETVLLVAVTPV